MRLIAFAALALAAASAPATAAVTTATFTGTLYNAGDLTGLFGPPGTSLNGDPFTVSYRFNAGTAGTNRIDAGYFQLFYSGSYYGTSAAMSVTMTVGGQSQSIFGNYKGMILQGHGVVPGVGRIPGTNGDQLIYVLDGTDFANRYDSISFSLDDIVNDVLPTPDFTAPGHYHFAATTYQDNRFAFANGINEAYGALYATDLVVSVGVPEPAAWALMIGGFGLTGAALRRRSRIDRRAAVL